jgi:hypothetical protein
MVKRQGQRKRKGMSASKPRKVSVSHLLEVGTLESIKNAKQVTSEHLKYQWMNYAELAGQRSLIKEAIGQALTQTCISYSVKNWQRAVKYKYGLHPFSTMGSLVFIGGRFNTGTGVNPEVPFFPALYLAQDKDTALQEHLGQQPCDPEFNLSPREVALTNPASETIVSVSGKLDKILDLTNPKSLNVFIELVKNFKISKELIALARRLRTQRPRIIKTSDELLKTLLQPDWRKIPSNCDVPSNSQIFGHLIYSAGIEGILYPSKFTGKLCLAVFPRNFVGTDSFVVLDDEVPHPKVPARIDASSWRLCEMGAKEIIG